jgi:hypothetical protein
MTKIKSLSGTAEAGTFQITSARSFSAASSAGDGLAFPGFFSSFQKARIGMW